MGYNEERKYMIHVNGGVARVNVANDDAIVNTTQSNGVDTSQLEKMLSDVVRLAPNNLSQEDQSQVDDGVEVIRTELATVSPKKL